MPHGLFLVPYGVPRVLHTDSEQGPQQEVQTPVVMQKSCTYMSWHIEERKEVYKKDI